jgi:hypothetical protein
MPRPPTSNKNTNYNASVVTFRQQGKQIYANALLYNKSLSETCTNRVVAGNAATTSYSGQTYIDQRVGAVSTTCQEKAQILASDKCLPSQ